MHFSQLQAGYQGVAVTPVVDAELAQVSMTVLVGANCSGKSTLLKTIARLIKPVAGRCDVRLSRRKIGWMPQRSELEARFPLTVFELFSMGCWPRCGWFGGVSSDMREEIFASLDAVQACLRRCAAGHALRRPAAARALCASAATSRLWLLDEPFNGIDSRTVALLMTILQQQAGTTLLVVLHDRPLVARYFSDILSMDDARCRRAAARSRLMTLLHPFL
ncbi:metal ABC transporter ATP-binding protein [Candidatus Pantoea persica]|uniref:metal ABC transporter ATP-binding protein n=1 Tax=Candidatus Pantoea persica TaxID=2518128 RepID=UPI00215DBEB3|nr:ATP-binding cassette domain-containing protein [Candidatus Pantoea persica]MBA2815352.1 putative siderophore transport system ATP-bindingprotein YusV [Candidatus Pantoea persica]